MAFRLESTISRHILKCRPSVSFTSFCQKSTEVQKSDPTKRQVQDRVDDTDVDKPKKPKYIIKRPVSDVSLALGKLGFIDAAEEEDIPLKQRLIDVKDEFKVLAKQTKEDFQFALHGWVDFYGVRRNGELKIEYKFDNPETFESFKTHSEKDYNLGFSTCELVPTDNNTALFKGYLNTEIPKDGITERAGWCNLRSPVKQRAFGRYDSFLHWRHFTHIVLKIRGDGRTYNMNLNTIKSTFNIFWGDIWTYPLYTHGGPYWQITKIPFSKFLLTSAGRFQDKQSRVQQAHRIGSIGITLQDRFSGPFQLEIDWIGVCYDSTHREEFAYEGYSLPVPHV